ncbi:MAG: thioredoxin family protein [Anaerolineae bacterium]|nr:thioredoxin family protein [Anaerolineae bacterium]
MKPLLRIFVAEHCSGCKEALDIAHYIEQHYPQVFTVEVVDVSTALTDIPEAVFATPTYMLNNQVVSLGNPRPEDIMRWVDTKTTDLPTSTKKGEIRRSHDGCFRC